MTYPAKKQTKVTRLRNIEATRVDGVTDPANGFPVLMMKSVLVNATGANADAPNTGTAKAVNAQGGIDEKPDIAGAKGIIVDLFKLIASEAQEGATGAFSEISDIGMLMEAIWCLRCFLDKEQWGDEDDGEPIAKSASSEAESLASYVLKRKFSAAKRKELAEKGDALSDGSYPIENEEDLHNAAILARSGHGDVAGAKRLIARKAKELGVANPLAAEKSAETPDAPETPEDGQEVTPEVSKETEDTAPEAPEAEIDPAVASAIAKAVAPLEEANQELQRELAVLKATPIPGQVALTAPADARALSAKADNLAKAAKFRQLAERVTDREQRRYYTDRAKELEAV